MKKNTKAKVDDDINDDGVDLDGDGIADVTQGVSAPPSPRTPARRAPPRTPTARFSAKPSPAATTASCVCGRWMMNPTDQTRTPRRIWSRCRSGGTPVA